MRPTHLALTCCLALSGCSTPPPPPSNLAPLLDAIEQRPALIRASIQLCKT